MPHSAALEGFHRNDAAETNPQEPTMNAFTKALAALVLVAAAGLSTASFAYSRTVDFTNNYYDSVQNIQFKSIYSDNWGSDSLGQYYLDAGYHIPLTPPHANGQCEFDVLITFEDGSYATLWDVDFCSVSDITVDDDGSVETA
jgi:hypothetical protein